MGCVPAPSCKQALADATTAWPHRNRSSDGICGDASHQAKKSDLRRCLRCSAFAIRPTMGVSGAGPATSTNAAVRSRHQHKVVTGVRVALRALGSFAVREPGCSAQLSISGRTGADADTLGALAVLVPAYVSEAVPVGAVGSRSVSSQAILGQRDSFEMVGSDATAVPAEMVDLELVGDGADHGLVGVAVGDHLAPRTITLDGEVPVTRSLLSAGPFPTILGLVDLAPEALLFVHGKEFTKEWH